MTVLATFMIKDDRGHVKCDLCKSEDNRLIINYYDAEDNLRIWAEEVEETFTVDDFENEILRQTIGV